MSDSKQDSASGKYSKEERRLAKQIERIYPKSFPDRMRKNVPRTKRLPSWQPPAISFDFEVIGPIADQDRASRQITNADVNHVSQQVQAALDEVGAYASTCILYIHTGNAARPLDVTTKDEIVRIIVEESNLVSVGGQSEMVVEAIVSEEHWPPGQGGLSPGQDDADIDDPDDAGDLDDAKDEADGQEQGKKGFKKWISGLGKKEKGKAKA